MDKHYEAPAVNEIGELSELTQQTFNKVGTDPDVLSAINPNIVGSLVATP